MLVKNTRWMAFAMAAVMAGTSLPVNVFAQEAATEMQTEMETEETVPPLNESAWAVEGAVE